MDKAKTNVKVNEFVAGFIDEDEDDIITIKYSNPNEDEEVKETKGVDGIEV